jgi:tetrahydromethanopterin S-methyltransferase subunit G
MTPKKIEEEIKKIKERLKEIERILEEQEKEYDFDKWEGTD